MANRNVKKIKQKHIKQIFPLIAKKKFGFKYVREQRALATIKKNKKNSAFKYCLYPVFSTADIGVYL